MFIACQIYRQLCGMLLLASVGLFIPNVVYASPLAMQQVADGIYVHRGAHEDLDEGYHGDICNISFVIGENGIAVIDTGGSIKVGQQLLESIRAISSLPILYVINTHVHPDHIFGNAAFVSAQTQFVGHERLAEAMDKRQDSYMRINQQWLKQDFAGSRMVKPSIAVKNKLQIDLGKRVLTLTAHPTAHTNTDLTVFDEKTASLWTGDLLFIERTPSIDGDIKGWIKVNEALLQSPAKQVISGHGQLSAQQTWQQAMQLQQQYLTTLLQEVRASISKGITMEKAMNSAAISQKGAWQLFDIINRRNVNNIYPALEWE
jgi:quinoprotein relay system zinc metallohydrolase 2